MKRISTAIVGFSLIASTVLYASGDHTGDHMHEGEMKNHANQNGMTNVQMKSMDHKKMVKDMNHGENMQAYHNTMMVDGYHATLSSKKALKDGNNHMSIMLVKDGKSVEKADVNIKFSMPSMPGMEFTEHAKMNGNEYKTTVDFSMMGEWSYDLMFKTRDGHMHTTKGSVNLK